MDLMATLRAEHHLIAQVLDAIETYAARLAGEQAESGRELCEFVDVLTGLTENVHHRKEEGVLVAGLIAHGFSTGAGPLAELLDQHTESCRILGWLQRAADEPRAWTAADRAAITGRIRGYVTVMREHLATEDSFLATFVSELPAGARQQLDARFAERVDADEDERLRRAAAELLRRYPTRGP